MDKPPIFIGLIGAPGSGKTKLADGLNIALDKVEIVDKLAENIGDIGDFAVGMFANYFGNLAVSMYRVCMERAALREEPQHIVVCGTHIDTVAYAAINGYVDQPPEGKEHELYVERMQVFFRFLGMLIKDTFGYQHIFYLPVESDDNFITQVDKEIQEALKMFDVEYTTLEGDPDERLGKALVEINATPEGQ